MELNTMREVFIFIYMTSKTPNSPEKSKHSKRILPDPTAKTIQSLHGKSLEKDEETAAL